VAGGPAKRVTWDSTYTAVPRWSHDGKWIYFRSHRSGEAQIWKKPVQGGEPVEGSEAIQVTQNGARIAMESSDGKWLYFSKGEIYGIWRMPTNGGREELVTDTKFGWRNWVVHEKGIYFIRNTEVGYNIEYFDFKSGIVQVLLSEEGEHGHYLSVTPDGKYALYTKRPKKEADIYLVENFD
jgi:Tol biopolymer transport system component